MKSLAINSIYDILIIATISMFNYWLGAAYLIYIMRIYGVTFYAHYLKKKNENNFEASIKELRSILQEANKKNKDKNVSTSKNNSNSSSNIQ